MSFEGRSAVVTGAGGGMGLTIACDLLAAGANVIGVDLCHRARARQLCLFHHEPLLDDDALDGIWRETIRYEELVREDHALEISSAWDGLEVAL